MTTLYLLCGLLCDDTVWLPQANALRDDYDVRIISFQDFDSIPAMAAHVLSHAPDQFALAGHSMGGRVALDVFRQAPQRIERLALLDTGYAGAAPTEAAQRGALVSKALEEGIGAIAATWALPMLAPHRREDSVLVNEVLDMVQRMSGDIYARQTRALLSRPDATPVLSTIHCPTLLLCGQEDSWSPPARHEVIASLIPGSMLRIIDRAGHMSTMEEPGAVLAAMQEWLAMSAPGNRT